MDTWEILVHVAAPSRVQDDKRYLAIAEAVAHFEPVTLIRLRENSEFPACAGNASGTAQIRSSDDEGATEYGTSPAGASLAEKSGPTEARESVKKSISKDAGSKQTITCKQPVASHMALPKSGPDLNPLCNDSILNPTTDEPQVVKAQLNTPNIARPRTAPEIGSAHIQVPCTRSSQKRAYSDSFPFSSGTETVPDSQPSPDVGRLSRSISRTQAPLDPNKHLTPASAKQQHLRVGDEQSTASKRRRLNAEPRSAKSPLDTLPLEASEMAQNQPYFLRDRSLDWTSPESSDPDTSSSLSLEASTVTPSQQPRLNEGVTDGAIHRPKIGSAFSPITLNSTNSCNINDGAAQEMQQTISPLPRPRMGAVQETEVEENNRTCTAILSLPEEINAPNPTQARSRFTTHISRNLQYIANRIPLAGHFRPATVTRDVGVLERGFWEIPITVADPTDVEVAGESWVMRKELRPLQRRADEAVAPDQHVRSDTRQQGSLGNGDQDDDTEEQSAWTASKFLNFWGNLASYIQHGKAGWGIRVVREVQSRSRPESSARLSIRLRIFTWGEVIGHVWLALWMLSDKLIVTLPMRWIAANGEAVVTMTGAKGRQGELGPWVRKSPPGEKCIWGIAATS